MTDPHAFLQGIRALIIDLDGVLWRGRQAFPGVADFFELLRARGLRFIVASNNSSRPTSDIVERLKRLAVAIREDEILTSAEATALYLPRLVQRDARIFLVGGIGIARALIHAGYHLVEEEADVVVAGLDLNLTYSKLRRATLEISRGAKFIGTNADTTYPGEHGIAPGAGAILAALQVATGVAPIVIGKPERAMFDVAVERLAVPREAVAMLGDRLDTDIEGAQRAGLKSILVLSGITTPEMLADSRIIPDAIFADVGALLETWKAVSL